MADWDRKQLLTLVDEIEAQFGIEAIPESILSRYQSAFARAKQLSKSNTASRSDVMDASNALRHLQQDLIWHQLQAVGIGKAAKQTSN